MKFAMIIDAVGGNMNNVSLRFVHTYGLSNTLYWLKDKKPYGNTRMEGVNPVADQLWLSYLESTCQSDTIYLMATKQPVD